MSVKSCSRCGLVKSLEGFHRHEAHKDGRSSQCKKCLKAKKGSDAPPTMSGACARTPGLGSGTPRITGGTGTAFLIQITSALFWFRITDVLYVRPKAII
jgi:hypothetical protein